MLFDLYLSEMTFQTIKEMVIESFKNKYNENVEDRFTYNPKCAKI
jgi:hypothetical protein